MMALRFARGLILSGVLVSTAASTIAGCGQTAASNAILAEEHETRAAAAGVTDTPGPGCTYHRWVGIKSTASCPAVANWAESAAFPGATSIPGSVDLSDFCLYEWQDPNQPDPTAFDVDSLLDALPFLGVTGVREDCIVVGPQSTLGEVETSTRNWLREDFRQGAGWLSALPSQPSATIRIAVADASPTQTSGTIPHGIIDHGYSVGWIAQDLACPGGPSGNCASSVTSHLALPRIDNQTTDTSGGYFGTRLELAQAIYDAVESWRTESQGHERLIINLSVGWEPDANSAAASSPILPTDPNAQNAPEDAVLGSLIHAACYGALIVAANGNHPGGAGFTGGAVYPSAWQLTPAPSESECVALEGNDYADDNYLADPTLPLQDRPLVFGVGGLDHTGAPLATTRPGSLSRLAAIGFGGLAGDPQAPLPAPLMGSSAATAIVSGIAATLWSYASSMTAHEIMSILYDSGTLVPSVALGLQQPDFIDQTKRVSLCSALAQLCAQTNSCTLDPASCAPLPSSNAQHSPMPSSVATVIDSYYGNAEVISFVPLSDQTPPNAEYQGIATPPWVHPQPLDASCGGACVANVLQKLIQISINPAYAGAPLHRTTLVITDTNGFEHVFVPDPNAKGNNALSDGLTPGEKVVIADVPLGTLDPAVARLSWQTQDLDGNTASLTEEILIRY